MKSKTTNLSEATDRVLTQLGMPIFYSEGRIKIRSIVEEVYSAGYEDGYEDGYQEKKDEINEAYEQGYKDGGRYYFE